MRRMQNVVLTLISFFFLGIIGCAHEGSIAKQEFLFMPKGSPAAAIIDVIDLRQTDLDTKLAAITLQGLVNADEKSRVCVLNKDGDTMPTEFWLNWFKKKSYIQDFQLLSLTDYFSKYSSCYDKVIVYDPNMEATINIATMIGSVERGIVVAPRDADRFGKGKLIENLQGRWRTNVQAYEWALENLWAKMNHTILASQHPTFAEHSLRDYLVRNKIFQYWITGKNAEDGDVASHEKELEFAKKVLALTPPSSPVIGWLDGGDDDHGMTEYGGVGLIGQYGKFMVPNNWGENFSFFSGVAVDIPKMFSDYRKRTESTCPELENDKVYLSFAVQESGDAPFYWQHVQRTVWQDKQRGKVPINWCLALSCLETCPAIVEWFFEQATPNDHFYISISGLGYAHPYREFFKHVPDPEEGWRKYIDTMQHYINLTGMREMGLYTDAWLPFDRKKQDAVTQRFAGLSNLDTLVVGMGRDEGIMENNGNNYLMGKNGVLVSHTVTRWDPANVGQDATTKNNDWLIKEIQHNTPSHRPAFIVVHPLSWTYYPSDLTEVLKGLGPEYVPVSLGDFNTLYKKAKEPSLSDFWDGKGDFIVDAGNKEIGLDFGMHFISTLWDNGTLYAYYINHNGTPFTVGLATSSEGVTFTDHGMVLDVGKPGEWDDVRASFPGVWKDGNTWYMVYEGSHGGFNPAAIGLATSQDGIHWTKDPANPILERSGSGFMSHEIGTPSLYKEGSTWYLFYHGYDLVDCQLGVATGTDLRDVKHYSTTVSCLPTSDTKWDCGTTGKRSSIFKEDGYYYMAYEGSTDSPYDTAKWSTGLARSKDLLTWTKCPRNPVIPQTSGGMGYDGPDILKTPDGRLHIYFREFSLDKTGISRTGRATLLNVAR